MLFSERDVQLPDPAGLLPQHDDYRGRTRATGCPLLQQHRRCSAQLAEIRLLRQRRSVAMAEVGTRSHA